MTADLDPPPFAGEVDAVAARVLRALDHRRPLVYVPAPWRLVMAVVRALPRALMRRLEF
jgi:decaprenylphospho-beta-D-erythro-pentofuranosid-2-ulose 2-reductase